VVTNPHPLTTPPSRSRYVALKFIISHLTGRNDEIRIHEHLASRSGSHPGSDRVLALLDNFKVQGPNGEHDVLVLKVVGPRLSDMYCYDPSVICRVVQHLVHQITLGISFLHDCGVIHAGQSTVLSTGRRLTRTTQTSTAATSRSRSPISTGNLRKT